MANISSNNLTSLYGGGKDTVITTTVVPNVAGTIPSKNLTTLYSGAGAPVTATTSYGNANVERFLNSGTDGGNTIQNIVATGNITGDYYFGNGYYLTGIDTSNANTANYANYANFAGNAFSVNVANVVGIGNIATLNLDGNVSNVLHGDGTFGPESGNLSANFALYAGNVTVNSQPNITSLGTLTGLNVNGVSNLGPVSNVIITGGSANYALITDGNGVLSWGQVANASNAANANYANFAGTAFSVNVANVVGIGNIATLNLDGNSGNILYGNGVFATVPNTAVANFANYAGNVTVNSQPNITSVGSLANLTVIGNITAGNANLGNLAIANYFSGDGSLLSNINGANVSNVANANYANYAGNLINGTSNVSIPVVNGNIVFSPNGIANAVNIQTTGQMNLMPSTSALNAIVINSIGTSVANDSSRISSFRYRGTMASPLSVQPGDTTMRFLTLGHNGTALQTSSVASIRAQVDTSYTANGANIPIGWQVQVNDTNGGTNNETKNHNFYSNGNISFANSLVVNNNITSTVGVFYGNGAGLTNLPAGNISGNLSNLVVATANTELPIYQIQPTHNLLVGNTANVLLSPYAYKLTQDYGNGQNDGNLSAPGNESYIKYRGNSTSPASASANDRIQKIGAYGYNGTANTLAVAIDSRITNVNANSNAVFSGGSYNITTGNPLGDTGNANASSAYNSYVFDQWGRMIVTQGTAPTGVTNGLVVLNTYGGSPGPNNATSAGIVFNRYRGNRDSNLSLQPNDQTGRIIFIGSNGSGVFNTRVAQLAAYVDSSYVANTANVPQGMSITVCDNTTSYTQNFYANGNVSFANSVTAPGNIQGANLRSTSLLRGLGNTTLGDPSNIAAATHQINGNTSLIGNVFVGGGLANGSSLIMQYGNNSIQVLDGNILVQNANGNGGYLTGTFVRAYSNLVLQELGSGPNISMYAANGTISAIGNIYLGNNGSSISQLRVTGDKSIYSGLTLVDGQYIVVADNVNPTTGFSPLSFSSYNNANADIPYNRFFRARGTYASSAAVVAGDQINVTNYGVYADAGNTYFNVFNDQAYVTYNDGAGNVYGNLELYAFSNGSNLNLRFSNIYTDNNLAVNGNLSSNGGISTPGSLYVGGTFDIKDMFVGNVANYKQANTGFAAYSNAGFGGNVSMGTYGYNTGDGRLLDLGTGNISMRVQDGNIDVWASSNGGWVNSDNLRIGQYPNYNYFYSNGTISAANISLTGSANLANLQLVKFEETVVAGGTVSGTLTPNSSAGTIYNYTLNGNITINSLGNAVAGTSMTLILTQDGTGNRILSSTMKFASGLKTLSTAANATDILSVFYDGTTYYATLSRGFV